MNKLMVERALEMGNRYPYDGAMRNKRTWAYRAARGVLADLSDRGGIKHELAKVDRELREEIVDVLAAIIRTAFIAGTQPDSPSALESSAPSEGTK